MLHQVIPTTYLNIIETYIRYICKENTNRSDGMTNLPQSKKVNASVSSNPRLPAKPAHFHSIFVNHITRKERCLTVFVP